jgi:hypothetical protein
MVSTRRSKAGRRHWLGVSASVLARVCASGQRVHRLMLALACVCRRETLGGEFQAGRKRRQLDLARSRQRIAWLKVEPWSVSGRSSHDGEAPERWCCVQVAGVLAPAHKRARMCTGAAKTPKGDALPPSVCACVSQRLDLGGELGDGACTKHTTTSQPGERTTARHGRKGGSARYGELMAKTFCILARACTRV